MDLLGVLRADGSLEARRLRAALIETVEAYRTTPDKAQAQAELVPRLLGIEAGAADLLSGTVQSLRDRLYKESKRIGGTSQAGKSIRSMLKALETLSSALQQMVDASAEGNQALRESAQKLMAKAREQLQAVGQRG